VTTGGARPRLVRTVDEQGAPVPSALLFVTSSEVALPEVGRRTDAAGKTVVLLRAGRYRLRAGAPGLEGTVDVVLDDAAPETLTVVLRAAGRGSPAGR
jgi:hypothetical protein